MGGTPWFNSEILGHLPVPTPGWETWERPDDPRGMVSFLGEVCAVKFASATLGRVFLVIYIPVSTSYFVQKKFLHPYLVICLSVSLPPPQGVCQNPV